MKGIVSIGHGNIQLILYLLTIIDASLELHGI